MNLIRIKSLSTTIFLHRRLVESGSSLRLFANFANGKKNDKNNGTKKTKSTTNKSLDKSEQPTFEHLEKNTQNIFNKNEFTAKSDVHPNHMSLPINRRSLSSKQSSGDSSPPPSSSSNNLIWMGAAAAIMIGGGLYLINNSKDDKKTQPQTKAEVPIPPKKPTIPLTSSEIPKEVPYLLIGGGTASFTAFRAIKSHDPKAKVMVLSDELETPYMRPPLSKELWLAELGSNTNGNKSKPKTSSNDTESDDLTFKQWNGIERSLYYEPIDFYTYPSKLMEEPNGGVAIVRGYRVKKIDVENRIAILTDGTEIKYHKCLLATGSTPKNLPVFENASAKVKEHLSLFKTIEDFRNLKKHVDQSKSVAIIGGGFLGSELACALAKYGESNKLQVHQIFHEKGNMGKILPEFLSEWTTERVREEGVNVIPKTDVQSAEYVNNQVKLTLQNGQTILCDHVVVAVGSEPNTSVGKESGLEIDNVHGGYLVNAELAARNNLYVAGDAACFYDTQLGRRRVEHHDHAVVSGRLAGENMVGLGKPYKHQSMFWSDLGPEIGYEALGIIDSTLPTVSVFVKKPSDSVKSSSKTESDDKQSKELTPSVQAAAAAEKDEKDEKDDFSKGVVFYLRGDKIVGIVLWNVFNRINTARAVLSQDTVYDDLNEVAKLFDLYL